jgi:hypothetical protein
MTEASVFIQLAEADGATFQRSPLGAWYAKDCDGITVVLGALSHAETARAYCEDKSGPPPEAVLSSPQQQRGEQRYDAYGYTGAPGRFDRWKNADRGGAREYSPYFPHDGGQGPAAPYTMYRRGEDGEGDRVAPPMALRRAPETYGSARGGQRMCLDTRTQHPVDPALCERESRRLQNR